MHHLEVVGVGLRGGGRGGGAANLQTQSAGGHEFKARKFHPHCYAKQSVSQAASSER